MRRQRTDVAAREAAVALQRQEREVGVQRERWEEEEGEERQKKQRQRKLLVGIHVSIRGEASAFHWQTGGVCGRTVLGRPRRYADMVAMGKTDQKEELMDQKVASRVVGPLVLVECGHVSMLRLMAKQFRAQEQPQGERGRQEERHGEEEEAVGVDRVFASVMPSDPIHRTILHAAMHGHVDAACWACKSSTFRSMVSVKLRRRSCAGIKNVFIEIYVRLLRQMRAGHRAESARWAALVREIQRPLLATSPEVRCLTHPFLFVHAALRLGDLNKAKQQYAKCEPPVPIRVLDQMCSSAIQGGDGNLPALEWTCTLACSTFRETHDSPHGSQQTQRDNWLRLACEHDNVSALNYLGFGTGRRLLQGCEGEWPTGLPVYAAAAGHTRVLRWLVDNKGQECRSDTMSMACVGGHLETVEFLHEEHGVQRCPNGMALAVRHSTPQTLALLEYLHRHVMAFIDRSTIIDAATSRNYRTDVLRFLAKHATPEVWEHALQNRRIRLDLDLRDLLAVAHRSAHVNASTSP